MDAVARAITALRGLGTATSKDPRAALVQYVERHNRPVPVAKEAYWRFISTLPPDKQRQLNGAQQQFYQKLRAFHALVYSPMVASLVRQKAEGAGAA